MDGGVFSSGEWSLIFVSVPEASGKCEIQFSFQLHHQSSSLKQTETNTRHDKNVNFESDIYLFTYNERGRFTNSGKISMNYISRYSS